MATGSLLGKADTTLVQGALKEAMADVPADMSKVYTKREENLKAFTEGLNEAWTLKNKDDIATKAWIDGKRDTLLTNVSAGQINTAQADLMDSTIKDYKVELMKHDTDSLEYKKIQAKVNKLASVTENNNQIFMDLINADLLELGSGDEIRLWKQMINDYNNDTNESNIDHEDGDFVYTLKGTDFSTTLSKLKETLAEKDATVPTDIEKSLANLIKNPNKQEWNEDYINETVNGVAGKMKTPADRRNVMTSKIYNMPYSIHDALGGKDPKLQAEIFDVLNGIVGLDLDNDGVADSKPGDDNGVNFSYSNKENVFKLYRAISDSPEGSEIISKIIVNNLGEGLVKQGEKLKGTDWKEKTDKLKYEQLKNLIDNPLATERYRVWADVPSVSKEGEFIRISPTDQQKAYDNIENKTNNFQGAQGYYVRLKDGKYLRYDSFEDFNQDKNDNNKYSIAQNSWEKTFGKDSEWGANKYIDETRVRELEAAIPGVAKSR